MKLTFTKMHGLGNDFMVINRIREPVELSSEQIRQLSDRHFGVGFDQLLIVEAPDEPDVDFRYRIFNADGSEVEHCGNGARCFARYVLDKRLIARPPIRVQTVNRKLTLDVSRDGMVTVDMGIPDFTPASLPFDARDAGPAHSLRIGPQSEERQIQFHVVSVGNPHAVLTVEDLEDPSLDQIGPALVTHPAFPQGVNAGFMQLISRDQIRLRVFERGVGETIACGTGACAAVVTGIRQGLLDHTVKARLHGGELTIHWPGEGESIRMSGPATTVYEGQIQMHNPRSESDE